MEISGNRQVWKPGNMLYPLPAVMVSAADLEGNANILTIAWYNLMREALDAALKVSVDGNDLFRSSHALYFCTARALLLPYDPGDGGIRGQSDY